MADEPELTIGAYARCSDGPGGKVIRIVIDPATRTVTHLAIELEHHFGPPRLVPLHLVDATGGDIRLRCTLAEFEHLDTAEKIQMVDDIGPADLGPADLATPLALAQTEVTFEDEVPQGETEVRRGQHVQAVDGEIGQMQGVTIDRGDHRVTQVLLREGHLWGRKEVAIPASAITDMTDGIVLNLTKQQVEDLPPLNH